MEPIIRNHNVVDMTVCASALINGSVAIHDELTSYLHTNYNIDSCNTVRPARQLDYDLCYDSGPNAIHADWQESIAA